MKLASAAFPPGGAIPKRYSCDGADISPPVTIHGIPRDAVCLAITMIDLDTPRPFVHWLLCDAPVTGEIPEGRASGITGYNDFGKPGYGGPCPPPGSLHPSIHPFPGTFPGSSRIISCILCRPPESKPSAALSRRANARDWPISMPATCMARITRALSAPAAKPGSSGARASPWKR